jgi:hypothetical protein
MNANGKPNISQAGRPLLKDWTVGVSISDSPDLQQLGMGGVHLQDALVEFARYLLACGASLAYGGDLRKKGFTEILFDLVETHNLSGVQPFNRIVNFLAWPIHLRLTDEQQAELKRVADFHPIGPPDDLGLDTIKAVDPDSTPNRYIWARCLTAMREEMNALTHARLFLGGEYQPGKYLGKYPGLVEEASLALRDKKPVFLMGGFGGCTKAIIDALVGDQTEVLTAAFQMSDSGYADLVELYNERIPELSDPTQGPVDYEELVRFFRSQGIEGLNNGLGEADNQRLFETPYIPEMISLVLKGLTRLSKHG